MQNEKKNKHMTLQNRIEIQECLSRGMAFKSIATRNRKKPQQFPGRSNSMLLYTEMESQRQRGPVRFC